MPLLGLGTWENDNPSECANTIKTALEMGYRHIDTAQVYGNEGAVGQGIAAADVPREEMFIATKVWIDKLGYEDVLTSTQRSLEKLGIDTVDLLYVHWPVDTYNPVETFRALHKLVSDGKADRIGISNFEPNQVDTAIEKANVFMIIGHHLIWNLHQQRLSRLIQLSELTGVLTHGLHHGNEAYIGLLYANHTYYIQSE